MVYYNDTNADALSNDCCVFINDIEENEDVFVNSSSVFMGDLIVNGNLTVQYNLTVYGHLEVTGDLVVSDCLTCKYLNAQDVRVENAMVSAEKVNCGSIEVGGNLNVKDMYCQSVKVHGMVYASGNLDIADSIDVNGTCVCLEYISVNGEISASSLVVNDYDIPDEADVTVVSISTGEILKVSGNTEPEEVIVSIADSDYTDITDPGSQLARTLEDVAVFEENLDDILNADSTSFSQSKEIFDNYGDFIPKYAVCKEHYEFALSLKDNPRITLENWFDLFVGCMEVYCSFPATLHKNICYKQVVSCLKRLFAFPDMDHIRTKSAATWSKCMGFAEYLINERDGQFSNDAIRLNTRLFTSIGLRPTAAKLMLPDK